MILPQLSDLPGVTYRTFCSFSCPNEASGEITLEDDNVPLPICDVHLSMFVERGLLTSPDDLLD